MYALLMYAGVCLIWRGCREKGTPEGVLALYIFHPTPTILFYIDLTYFLFVYVKLYLYMSTTISLGYEFYFV